MSLSKCKDGSDCGIGGYCRECPHTATPPTSDGKRSDTSPCYTGEWVYPPETKALKEKHESVPTYVDMLRLCKEQTSLLIKLEKERDKHRLRDQILTKAAKEASRKLSPSVGNPNTKLEREVASILWNARCDLGNF